MNSDAHQKDLALAQETCAELRSGNNDAILPMYNKYHTFFFAYTRRRVSSTDDYRAASIVDDFWVELLNAKAICDFKGLAALKTYLFRILKFRIIDNVRRANRQGAYNKNISDKDHEIDGFGSDDKSPEDDLMHKEKIKIIHETLVLLADTNPSDAYLVKMYLEGLNYNQMAERSLDNKPFTKKQLDKKNNAIKKQFTRSRTGSLAKFKSCFKRIMIKNNIIQGARLN